MRALYGEKKVLIPLLKLGFLVLLAAVGCTQAVEVPSPTLAPTPTTILPLTPKSTVTSPPTPSPGLPVVATLSAAEVQGLTHPGIRSALADLRQRVREESCLRRPLVCCFSEACATPLEPSSTGRSGPIPFRGSSGITKCSTPSPLLPRVWSISSFSDT